MFRGETGFYQGTGGKDGPPGGQFRRTAIYPVGGRARLGADA